jgi:hypothetical protein
VVSRVDGSLSVVIPVEGAEGIAEGSIGRRPEDLVVGEVGEVGESRLSPVCYEVHIRCEHIHGANRGSSIPVGRRLSGVPLG